MLQRFRHWLTWYPGWVILGLTVVFSLFCIGMTIGLGHLKQPGLMAVAAYVMTAAFLLYSLLNVVAALRMRLRPAQEAALGMLFLVLMFLCHPQLLYVAAEALHKGQQVFPAARWLSGVPGLWILGNASVILTAAFLGRFISRIIREPSMMLVVAVVAAIVDFWGVYYGFVHFAQSTEQGKQIVQQFSAAVPGAQAASSAGLPVVTSIGIGDFLFVAVFLAAIHRLKLNEKGAFWATFIFILIAPLFFLVGVDNLPGLPFIAAAILLANWRYIKLSKEEVQAVILGGIIIMVLVVGVIFLKKAG
jgi:hypothetical protein